MDIKKKILLGDNDIISKNNEDLYLNINLDSSFSSIRNDKFENVFDVEKQFKKERNSSTNFRIYGIIDATITDCNNLSINVFSNSGTTGLSNYVKTITSTGLAYDGINVYGKKRGKYVVDLDDYSNDFVYFEIPSNNLTYKTQIYSQQVIFRDSEGTFVEYGTETLDIDNNGNVSELSNNFYFLYNKHWIKKDLLIIEEKPASVFINTTDDEVPRINEASTPADRVTIIVSLDKPSPFGLEKTDIGVLTSTLDSSEIVLTDFNFNFLNLPHTISFATGEQNKLFYFYSPLDSIQEFLEGVTLELTNFVNVSTGSPLQYSIEVEDKTPRNKIKLNFQDTYQNRNYFSGRLYQPNTSNTSSRYSYPMPSVLRNGLFFEGTPMEFYPTDNYTLKIKNVGDNTILPVNQKLGITEEKIFLSNQELTFNIIQEYENTELNSIKFTFKSLNPATTDTSYYSLDNGFRINGVPLVKYGYGFKISYNNFLAYFKKAVPPSSSGIVDGWSFSGLEVPFTIVENATDLTITIIAKSPGTRLDLSTFGDILPNLFTVDDDEFQTFGVKAEIVQEFVYDIQKPLEIELPANFGGNLFGKYQFTIQKTGYDTMGFTNTPIPASLTPDTYYLVSGLNTVLRNWNDSTSSVVYNHNNVTSNWGANASSSNPTYGSYKTGEVYINGMVLLANQYLSNTLFYSSNPQANTALNQSHAINSSGNFSHDFLPAPITVIPETNSILATNSISQYGYLAILKPNPTTLPAGVSAERSFDFRTGTTGAYNTYYTNDNYDYGGLMWNSSSAFYSSGGTVPSTNSITTPRTLKVLLETGQASPFISPQGIQGVGAPLPGAFYNEFTTLYGSSNPATTQHVEGHNALSVIRLESQTPGNPFEITNIKELRYLTGANAGTDYTKGSIVYLEARPNQTAGITPNIANNKMGGFSVTHP